MIIKIMADSRECCEQNKTAGSDKSKNTTCRTADQEPSGIPAQTILQCDHARRGRQMWCPLGCCFYVNAPSTSLEKENIKTPKGISSLIRVILPPSLITKEVNEDRRNKPLGCGQRGSVHSKEQVHRPPRWRTAERKHMGSMYQAQRGDWEMRLQGRKGTPTSMTDLSLLSQRGRMGRNPECDGNPECDSAALSPIPHYLSHLGLWRLLLSRCTGRNHPWRHLVTPARPSEDNYRFYLQHPSRNLTLLTNSSVPNLVHSIIAHTHPDQHRHHPTPHMVPCPPFLNP